MKIPILAVLAIALLSFASRAFGSCASEYLYRFSDVFDEFNSSVILPTVSVKYPGYKFYWFYSQPNVEFSVSIEQFSGDPAIFISTAKKNLRPSAESNDLSSTTVAGVGPKITVKPVKAECYGIAVRTQVPSSFQLKILSSADSLNPPKAPVEKTCSSIYWSVGSSSYPEYSGQIWLPTTPLKEGDTNYLYYNAKAGVPFSLQLDQLSGSLKIYAARAVLTENPGSGSHEFESELLTTARDASSSPVTVIPTATECYAIAVHAKSASSYGLQILNNPVSTPVQGPPCSTFWRNSMSSTYSKEYSSSALLPTEPLEQGKYAFVFYNSKKSVPFKIQMKEHSGSLSIYAARAVYSTSPDSTTNEYEAKVSSSSLGVSTAEVSSITVFPTATECYVVRIVADSAASYGLEFVSSDSVFSEVPAQKTCESLYPTYVDVNSPELFGAVRLPTRSLAKGHHNNFYYNAKKGEEFSIRVDSSAGESVLLVSRAASTLFPRAGNHEIIVDSSATSSGEIVAKIVPTASECYSISVVADKTTLEYSLVIENSDTAPLNALGLSSVTASKFQTGSLNFGMQRNTMLAVVAIALGCGLVSFVVFHARFRKTNDAGFSA